MRHRNWVVGGAAAAIVAAGGMGVWLAAGSDSSATTPRARQYTDFNACVLTDGQGVVGRQAASVWSGMEDASLTTHAKVSSLPVYGPATVANAVPYVNSLVQRRCDMVLAVGGVQAAAVEQVAPRHSGVRFVVIGQGVPRANVTVLKADSTTRSAVAATVRQASRD
ncbi:BMP family ABC transporter substrate-binding protein [Streptomyces sp. PTM05]|uniref:BMP family ABC transporter substrate-binding protein n=1 Tax=Streptantibioticus parmotrematis TaxID=2873249 RepID=A0ABS7QVM3_9ACTN|nr:BMP family ABC transporter substrate-binding protein [Streptantibioticus parmotrematis]MBY8885842.1 BMP family ABC transporter substrate-binding protein [Streptantibioticus parmotrematis]